MREPSSHLGAGLEKQSIWSGGDRALAVGSRSARSSFRHRARGHPGGANNGSAQNGGSIHDWVARRVETARISLKRTPRFRLAPRGGQNGTRPGLGRFCTGSALSALWKAGSGFPIDPGTSEATPLLRASTQGPRRRSACPTPTFREDGRYLPPPPPNPMARGRPVRAPSAIGESGWASRVDRASQICTRGAGRRKSHF